MLAEGVDPAAQRDADRQAEASAAQAAALTRKTFAEVVDEYVSLHRPKWRSAKHAAQWESTLSTYTQSFATMPVADVGTTHVVQALSAIWVEKTETARRLRQRIFAILDFAHGHGYRPHHPADSMKAAIEKTLPSASALIRQKKEHFRALDYAEVHGLVSMVRNSDAPDGSKAGLEFLILCASRTREVLDCQWSEIDFKTSTWVIPAIRYKTSKEHRVPLSRRAVEILKQAHDRPNRGKWVFTTESGHPFSQQVWLEMLKRFKVDTTVHGLRSSFRNWVSEQTTFSSELAEMALGHSVGNEVERSYLRTDLLDRRRALMQAWADYISKAPPKQAAVVTAIGAARAA